MKYLILLFQLCLLSVINAQTGKEIYQINPNGITPEQILYRTAFIYVKGTIGKDSTNWNGCGFIINGKYVATCYHVYGDSSLKPFEIKILYNCRSVNKKIIYDSVYATLNYQTSIGQYDFKKHIYKESDKLSDFIVLKLLEPVKCISPKIDTGYIKIGSTLFATQASFFENGTINNINVSAISVSMHSIENGEYVQTLSIGYLLKGYSGSPIFNIAGYVTGIEESGVRHEDLRDFLSDCLQEGIMKKSKVDEMLKKSNAPDYSLFISTDIKYLIKRYMKGYL